MKKKKIIAIIVAVVLVASVFFVGTVANTKNTSIAISIDKTEIKAGETATVTVTASADYPVATFSIPVFYDKTMVTVSDATAALTGYDVANVTTDLTATDVSKIYAETGVDSSDYGFVLVTYIGGANDTVSALENATVLTFTITAKSDVTGNALVECVTESAKTEENVAGMLYFGTTTSGTKITSIPENVEGIEVSSTSVKIGSTIISDAQLVAATGKSTVIDETNKYVYGITPESSIEEYIFVNGGTYELVANASEKTNGTGAIINVKDSAGTVIDTYTVIIFGDVDGDGGVTVNDKMAVKQYTEGYATDISTLEAIAFAADVDGQKDGVTVNDKMAIKQYTEGYSIAVPNNPYAK